MHVRWVFINNTYGGAFYLREEIKCTTGNGPVAHILAVLYKLRRNEDPAITPDEAGVPVEPVDGHVFSSDSNEVPQVVDHTITCLGRRESVDWRYMWNEALFYRGLAAVRNPGVCLGGRGYKPLHVVMLLHHLCEQHVFVDVGEGSAPLSNPFLAQQVRTGLDLKYDLSCQVCLRLWKVERYADSSRAYRTT